MVPAGLLVRMLLQTPRAVCSGGRIDPRGKSDSYSSERLKTDRRDVIWTWFWSLSGRLAGHHRPWRVLVVERTRAKVWTRGERARWGDCRASGVPRVQDGSWRSDPGMSRMLGEGIWGLLWRAVGRHRRTQLWWGLGWRCPGWTLARSGRKTGGQEPLKTRGQLGALSSEFPLGKSLSLDTSPSGDLLALVSGMAGESLFAHLISSWSLWETGHFVFTALLPYLSLSSPIPAHVPLEMATDLRHSAFLFLNHPWGKEDTGEPTLGFFPVWGGCKSGCCERLGAWRPMYRCTCFSSMRGLEVGFCSAEVFQTVTHRE